MDEMENRPELQEENPEFTPYDDVVTEDDFEIIEEKSAENPKVVKPESPFADSPYITPFDTGEAVPQKKKKTLRGKGVFTAVLTGLLVIGCCGITASLVNLQWQREMDNLTRSMLDKINALQSQIHSSQYNNSVGEGTVTPGLVRTPDMVYAQTYESVVAVTARQNAVVYGQQGVAVSTGSGFILSEDGYVVTNYHVIEGSEEVKIQTVDGQTYRAVVVGSDATNDVALLKAEAQGLKAVTLGSSSQLAVGQQVVAIGNPLGKLTSTLTVGYVSAKDRVVTTDGASINMIQTDAAINSGNSGGPLFDMNGHVVGITTAKFSGTSSGGASIEGIGFAIPIDDVSGMLQDLKEFGYVTGAYLGVIVKNVPEEVQEFGLPAGAYVDEVSAGYAAEKAGIRKDDIIVDLGGYKVTGINDLTRALRNFKAGETVSVTVYRGGQEEILSVTLDEKPQETAP